MIAKKLLTVSFAGLLAGLTTIGVNAQTAAALSGKVYSTEEGLMEGVLVSAKKEGSTVTTTVVSNAKGEFSFPADRMEPGHYNIAVRAAGYVLSGPRQIDVAAGAPATAEVKLAKAKSIQAQLSNGEWIMSAPGDDRIKSFLPDCVGCHTLQRVFSAMHTPAEWKNVFARMGRYAPETVPTRPQLLLEGGAGSERPRIADGKVQSAAELLVSANVNNPDNEGQAFKRIARPKGRATNVIITEYDLPRKEAQPHDVIVDADGHAWYTDFGAQFVGELDTKTGKVVDYKLELLRPDQPKGSLDLEFDPAGNLWVGMSYQGGASKIDRKTKQVTTYPLNKDWLDLTTQTNMVTPTNMYVDNKVWMTDTANRNVYRLDITTGKWENLGVSKLAGRQISGYGLPTDKNNNVYMLEFGGNSIGMRNAKNPDEVKIWSTTAPRTRPRRGRLDDQGRLWFAQYGGNAIGMFDDTTEQMKEWKLPNAWGNPYDVVPSKVGAEVWTGSMSNDYVSRLDTKSGEITEYLLPRTTNIRRVFVEETGPKPVLWVGNNHGSALVRVEPPE